MNEERITYKQNYVRQFRDEDSIPVRHSQGRDMYIPIPVFREAIINLIGVTSPSNHVHSYLSLTDRPTIPAAQIQADWNQANGAALDFIKNKPARNQSAESRSLNTAFQISATRDAWVSYSVEISTTASLSGGQTGTVFLEIADDAAFTTGVQELARFVNGNSVSLAIAITIGQVMCGVLAGYVPAGKFARLRTANTVGTPGFNYRSGQKVLL